MAQEPIARPGHEYFDGEKMIYPPSTLPGGKVKTSKHYGNYPDGGQAANWDKDYYRHHWYERLVAKIELDTAAFPKRWAIAVAIAGFFAASIAAAFLPLAPVYGPLSDIVSTALLFLTGLWEYWIVRIKRHSPEENNGVMPWYMLSRTRKTVRIESEDGIPDPPKRGVVYLIGPPRD